MRDQVDVDAVFGDAQRLGDQLAAALRVLRGRPASEFAGFVEQRRAVLRLQVGVRHEGVVVAGLDDLHRRAERFFHVPVGAQCLARLSFSAAAWRSYSSEENRRDWSSSRSSTADGPRCASHQLVATMATPGSRPARLSVPFTTKAWVMPGSARISLDVGAAHLAPEGGALLEHRVQHSVQAGVAAEQRLVRSGSSDCRLRERRSPAV